MGTVERSNILLVDDRSENLVALEGILESLKQNLVRAASGSDALKYLLKHDVAVILLDVEMPGMDGFQTAQLIRERERSRHTPIIFLTAFNKTDLQVSQGYSLGGVDYLSKPIDPVILRSKVSAFVDLFNQGQEVKRQAALLSDAYREIARKNTELGTERDFVTAILDTVGSLVLVLDSECRILRANRAWEKTTGYSSEEVKGRYFWEFFEASLGHDELARVPAMIEREDIWLSSDGSRRLVTWCRTSLEGDARGNPYFVVTGVDITERKRIEEERAELAMAQAAKADVERVNLELEIKVRERTQELEGFTYSVSHDMRAPVRALDGFTRILIEEYSHVLDEEGNRLLQIIRVNTLKMGELIDGLLALSRLGREQMKMTNVDMADLARNIFEDCKSAIGSNRAVSFKVGRMPSAYGDKRLITQVFENLLSNALKFTRNKGQAVIQVGYQAGRDEDIYYVRDNGVGFDMQHSDKLFGTFQRLHGVDEFEGTGIGLATVKRIIHRHDGRVWAEAKVGEGATFYFSLPSRQRKLAS
jgi:PAS domain S-box-containing protein